MSIGGHILVKYLKEAWTECSNDDFKKWFREGGGLDDAHQPADHPAGQTCMNESKGKVNISAIWSQA